jgi:hypothetical protein
MQASSKVAAAEIATPFGDDPVAFLCAKYDVDGSGSFSIEEVRAIVKDFQSARALSKQLKKIVVGMLVLIVLLMGCLVATSITGAMIGGEKIKENRNPDCSDGTCDSSRLVRVGGVESFVPSLFGLAALPTEQLAYLRDLTFYTDMSRHPTIGGVAEATFKVSGAYKRTDSMVHLRTPCGSTIEIDAGANTASSAPPPPLLSLPPAPAPH